MLVFWLFAFLYQFGIALSAIPVSVSYNPKPQPRIQPDNTFTGREIGLGRVQKTGRALKHARRIDPADNPELQPVAGVKDIIPVIEDYEFGPVKSNRRLPTVFYTKCPVEKALFGTLEKIRIQVTCSSGILPSGNFGFGIDGYLDPGTSERPVKSKSPSE